MSVDDQHDSSPGDTLEALLDLGALDALPRTGWLLRGVQPAESVAGHLLGVAHMALALAPRVDLPLDLGRVLAMAVLHDAGVNGVAGTGMIAKGGCMNCSDEEVIAAVDYMVEGSQ